MVGLRERMEPDLEARLMGETLIQNRSLNDGDYIELNDLIVPLELKDQVMGDSEPEVEDGKVVDILMVNVIITRNSDEIEGYPSFCDYGRRIHVNCAYNLQFHA